MGGRPGIRLCLHDHPLGGGLGIQRQLRFHGSHALRTSPHRCDRVRRSLCTLPFGNPHNPDHTLTTLTLFYDARCGVHPGSWCVHRAREQIVPPSPNLSPHHALNISDALRGERDQHAHPWLPCRVRLWSAKQVAISTVAANFSVPLPAGRFHLLFGGVAGRG